LADGAAKTLAGSRERRQAQAAHLASLFAAAGDCPLDALIARQVTDK
jgi:hypothetical protein